MILYLRTLNREKDSLESFSRKKDNLLRIQLLGETREILPKIHKTFLPSKFWDQNGGPKINWLLWKVVLACPIGGEKPPFSLNPVTGSRYPVGIFCEPKAEPARFFLRNFSRDAAFPNP